MKVFTFGLWKAILFLLPPAFQRRRSVSRHREPTGLSHGVCITAGQRFSSSQRALSSVLGDFVLELKAVQGTMTLLRLVMEDSQVLRECVFVTFADSTLS